MRTTSTASSALWRFANRTAGWNFDRNERLESGLDSPAPYRRLDGRVIRPSEPVFVSFATNGTIKGPPASLKVSDIWARGDRKVFTRLRAWAGHFRAVGVREQDWLIHSYSLPAQWTAPNRRDGDCR
jgi:hypothetical protein